MTKTSIHKNFKLYTTKLGDISQEIKFKKSNLLSSGSWNLLCLKRNCPIPKISLNLWSMNLFKLENSRPHH